LFEEYAIPIEFDGRGVDAWSIDETAREWNPYIQRDWFLSERDLAKLPTFAYRVLKKDDVSDKRDPAAQVAIGSASGDDMISIVSAGSRKEVDLKLFSGDRVRFRSGPVKGALSIQVVGDEGVFIPELPITPDWVTLEFSNSRLPRKFTARVVDHGEGVGEWGR
jgi:hypothetical protein